MDIVPYNFRADFQRNQPKQYAMKKIKSLATLCAVLIAFSSFGQIMLNPTDRAIHNGKVVDRAAYIFEGEVFEYKCYYNADSTFVYTEHTVQISQIFKGQDQLSCGQVNIITQGGEIDDLIVDLSHNIGFRLNFKTIFFCIKNRFPYLLNNSTDNVIVCQPLYSTPECIVNFYDPKGSNPPAYGLGIVFNSHQNVCDYIDTIGTENLPEPIVCGE